MPRTVVSALHWAPRILSVTFVLFLGLFALDVFHGQMSFWHTLIALATHLIPSLVLALVVWAAWHRPQIGAAVFAIAGALYIIRTVRLTLPADVMLSWCVVIAGPALLIAALYFGDWWMHKRVCLAS